MSGYQLDAPDRPAGSGSIAGRADFLTRSRRGLAFALTHRL
jgi:hypothetical protein